jgi:hypothetical protein
VEFDWNFEGEDRNGKAKEKRQKKKGELGIGNGKW